MGAFTIPMIRSYRKHVRSLEDESGKTFKGTSDFKSKTANLAAAIKESAGAVSISSQESKLSGSNQAGGVKKIETTINENSNIVTEIVEKTRSVATVAGKMEEDVLHGFSLLEKNVKKMGDIKEKNSGVINGIILLSNKVNKIRDIVRIITTITEQTKVIAFNAALEAATAGEAGKRFAVVAGEVNRLADDIAVLTRQIREQVEEIQSSSSSLILYSEEGSDRIAEGYKLIKDLEDVFKEIKSGAEITSNQAQTITISTQRQVKTGQEMNFAIAEVSEGLKYFINSASAQENHAVKLKERTQELERFLQSAEDPSVDSIGQAYGSR
jgi:methyl-accepting chemotaxis protein